MAIDGVFIHFLIKELKPVCLGERIFRFASCNENDFLISLSNKKQLLLSLNANNPHLRLTTTEYLTYPSFLSSFFKKYLEGGIIKDLWQYNNDRLVVMEITKADELGYLNKINMIIELTGKKANLIFVDKDFLIINALKRSFVSDERLIQPKAKYAYLVSGQNNPFLIDEIIPPLEGVSKLLMEEIVYRGNLNFLKEITPHACFFKWNDKTNFYAFDLLHLNAERTFFPSLSLLLDYVFEEQNKQNKLNNRTNQIDKIIKNEIKKLENKLTKQINEYQEAKDNLKYEKIANLLAANLHLVKPYQDNITVFDYDNREQQTISLNPKKTASENLNSLYNKYKKAKRTIINLDETISKTKLELKYYEIMQTQAKDASNVDLLELLAEIKPPKQKQKNLKPHFLTFSDKDNNEYFVGKNNLQNIYVTHHLAKANDYFFHVVNHPAAHVILRGDLNAQTINLAANLACFYSKISGYTAVDYTMVKWLKKVKKMSGSFVTYTKQKQVIVSYDEAFLKQHLIAKK